MLGQGEAEPAAETNRPQNPGRIFHKGEVVQYANDLVLDVPGASKEVDHPPEASRGRQHDNRGIPRPTRERRGYPPLPRQGQGQGCTSSEADLLPRLLRGTLLRLVARPPPRLDGESLPPTAGNAPPLLCERS